ncbi:hypothetical protein F750_4951 [Streptomyces sp. PAMC 26508]|nr:hypothetical protein F750_4951 [Streptomyces sp. PAMC 26508]
MRRAPRRGTGVLRPSMPPTSWIGSGAVPRDPTHSKAVRVEIRVLSSRADSDRRSMNHPANLNNVQRMPGE